MARISLEGLTKRFGQTEVVSDVSLEIADGEFVVVVGPSGCGKSTTLRLLAGLEEASAGVIAFDGHPVTDLAPAERNIAMVFQSYALYPHMTVEQNLGFGLRQRRMPRGEVAAKVGRVAELLGIVDLLRRRPRELSGGQRQRVAMGRAIVRDPSVFLFDEPLSNLDTALRTQMRIEIKRLHQQLRTTVVYVTHDQVEAMTLADRIVVMDGGRIVQVGDPASIYEHPATRFVASFIGSPPMSFVAGPIVRRAGGLALALGEGGGEAGLLRLPPRLAATAEPFVGQVVEIGLRPEHVSEGHRDGGGLETIVGDVELVERLGADTLVFLSVNGIKLTARGRPNGGSRPGTRCPFTIDMEHALLIQPTGQVLASEPPSIGNGRPGETP